MATKQSTQLCYQINGGTCRNKVSAKNSYICAAGHRAIKNMGRVGASAQLPIEAIHYMDEESRCNLARNPSITHDMAQALFDTEDEMTRRSLARNPSIDRDMMQALFNTGEGKIRWNLATNPSIDREMMQALFDTGDEWVKRDLATNPSIDREMAIALAKDGHAPIGYLENKSITELCERENISLLNEHPKEFGRAYLDHLLKLDKNLEEMKALLCYSYDCYRKAVSYSYEGYKEQILAKYPNDEEIKILLS